ACRQQVKITRTIDSQTASGVVAGTVLDPTGAVVPNASVTLIDTRTNKTRIAKTSDNGQFQFTGVDAGSYRLVIKTTGFKDLVMKGLKLDARETANVEATLLLDFTTMTVGIVALADDEFQSGKLRLSGEMLRKLPIR